MHGKPIIILESDLRAELDRMREREKATQAILRVISESRADEMPVFNAIVSSAARLCDASLAGLSLVNEARTKMRYAAVCGDDKGIFLSLGYEFDLNGPTQVVQTVNEARTIHTPDLADHPLYRERNPIRVEMVEKVGVRTFLSVPLVKGGVAFGCLNLNRNEVRPFSKDDIALAETFAEQAAIAIENVTLFKALQVMNVELGSRVREQVQEIERMGRLKRYLPTAVAEAVMSSGSEDLLKSHRVLLGVLMCDIRGFTAFCETAEPEETIEVLQTYHEEMGKLINSHGAGVDQRIGDGILVLFNDPVPCKNPAQKAVYLAIAMRDRMAELCATWNKLGHRLGFGVGVSLGYATVGIVGFEGRIDYFAAGTAINLAGRLCAEAESGEILISPRVRISIEDDLCVELKGEISFKGIHKPVEVYKLTQGAAL